MSAIIRPARRRRSHRQFGFVLTLVPAAVTLTACAIGSSAATPPSTAPRPSTTASAHPDHDHPLDGVATAMLANAAYQDLDVAVANGYASSIDSLGCFQNPDRGGMGVHYINGTLLDAEVDVGHPEALVYELDAAGHVAGLVAHEYIVPIEAWTSSHPPRLFGRDFHRHPVLPLWVLHAWLWKPNPTGMFSDWNPAVRQCPAGVPVFGRDLPVG